MPILIYVFVAFPDIEEREITEDWEFAILACDGIWDVMSNAVSFHLEILLDCFHFLTALTGSEIFCTLANSNGHVPGRYLRTIDDRLFGT